MATVRLCMAEAVPIIPSGCKSLAPTGLLERRRLIMAHKSIDDLRKELGLPIKARGRTSEDHVMLHLAFRMKRDDAKRLLLKCEEWNTSESLFARQAIVEKLDRGEKDR